MTFRKLYIPDVVLQVLRYNYALNSLGKINNLYRFLLAPLMFLATDLYRWNKVRERQYMIAGCQYGIKQVLAILNKLYGYAETPIIVKSTPITYFYHESAAPVPPTIPTYLFHEKDVPPAQYDQAYLSHRGSTVDVNTIYAPSSIEKDPVKKGNFEADLNSMLVYGVKVNIVYYKQPQS
ncbi:MAG: hypothetical protein RSF40_04915 [Oscillospiraceae bacterium]